MVKKQNKKKSKLPLLLGVLGLIIIVLILTFSFSSKDDYNSSDVDDFAKCITENGAIMYGAFWCPHCAKTKKMFGESFRYINYVECDPRGENEQSLLCIEKEIKSYDTWEFNDDISSRLIGEPSFEELAEKTGCVAPGKN